MARILQANFCDTWWCGKHSIQDAGNPFIPALPRTAWYGASQTLETFLKKIISLQVNWLLAPSRRVSNPLVLNWLKFTFIFHSKEIQKTYREFLIIKNQLCFVQVCQACEVSLFSPSLHHLLLLLEDWFFTTRCLTSPIFVTKLIDTRAGRTFCQKNQILKDLVAKQLNYLCWN